MSVDLPPLTQFRIEPARGGLVHLVFDMPDRTMNVFTNAAIHELGRFAGWLRDADVRGVVVRSGKANAFCAGADLNELGVAYDMIMAAHPQDRFTTAFDHFFPLGHAIRRLETAGKPVAVAIGGLALGGGCELALGGHYRVLVDDPRIGLGLPESLVGLLPGAGGTQRMPRLVGVDLALDVLLDGRQLAGADALAAGLVDERVAPGREVEAAEAWLLSDPAPLQPWDRPLCEPPSRDAVRAATDARRAAVLAATLGHYPAPLAILDCVEQGLAQPMDAAIRTEMSIFAALIQRAEPRNMIQTLFLGKLDYERAERKGAVPDKVTKAIADLSACIAERLDHPAMRSAGFPGMPLAAPARTRSLPGYWLDSEAGEARRRLNEIAGQARRLADTLSAGEGRMADYAIVRQTGFPSYLGGPFAFATRAAADEQGETNGT